MHTKNHKKLTICWGGGGPTLTVSLTAKYSFFDDFPKLGHYNCKYLIVWGQGKNVPSNDNGFFYFNSSNLDAAQNELNFQGCDYTAENSYWEWPWNLQIMNIKGTIFLPRINLNEDIVQALTIHHWPVKSPFLTPSPFDTWFVILF